MLRMSKLKGRVCLPKNNLLERAYLPITYGVVATLDYRSDFGDSMITIPMYREYTVALCHNNAMAQTVPV